MRAVKSMHQTFANAITVAIAAGVRAAEAAVPTPMIVREVAPNRTVRQEWFVEDGVCGFGWIRVGPGTHRFAKWLVKNQYARRSSYGGVTMYATIRTQSLARNEAWAHAAAQSLRATLADDATLRIVAESRID